MTLRERIGLHATQRPDAVALAWRSGALGYAALQERIDVAIAMLDQQRATVVALDLENGPDWVVFDIAALALGVCLVPLPAFFSTAQMRHAVTRAGAQAIISDRPEALRESLDGLLEDECVELATVQGRAHWLETRAAARLGAANVPAGVHKITYTSGTTGTPKGVLLGWPQMRAVAVALADAVKLGVDDAHLAVMPLAVLLENIAGVYAPLWAGASVTLAPMRDVGMRGAAGIDGIALADALMAAAASTAIFMPQTLQALVEVIERGDAARPPLRFAAVGGAPVSPRLLQRAALLGLPVYEGYGLSECGSVVCLNTPEAHRIGSVGRPLAHVGLAVAAGGEVIVRNSGFSGYLGNDAVAESVWRTGDIGELDADGFLHLHGRRRNVFITAFGRNVAPEWVERELMLEPEIAQAAMFGDARPFNVALINPAAGASANDVEAAIARANRGLPDYARISRWVQADDVFSPRNGMLTGTGRIRRAALWSYYRNAIESIYCEAISS